MKQNKVLAMALAAMGATGVANAANIGLKLTGATSYSAQGSANAKLNGTALDGWNYDDVAGTVTAPGKYQDMYFAGSLILFQHLIEGMVISSTGNPTTATAYSCYEGTFGPSNGTSSLCGNYNFGANLINETTTSWGPGLAFSRTLGGDDLAVFTSGGGLQQNLAFYSPFLIIGTIGAPGSSIKFGNTNSNGDLSLATVGYALTFTVLPPAADDGTIYVSPLVAKVIPVGKNDIGFTDPVTVTVTTAPTKGVINAISAPGAASGMTITYTANVGESGTDTFVYDMVDGSPLTDSATVTIDISPDADNDTIPDNNDNCRTVSNNLAGTVPGGGTAVPGSGPPIAKSQLDSDNDGYGNRCDGDFNQSPTPVGTKNVDTTDYTIFRSVINKPYSFSTNAAESDLNGSGTVDTTDYTIFRTLINKLPGPSGLACAGGTSALINPCLPAPQ